MKPGNAAKQVEQRLRAANICLTMGGEPTYVPLDPKGAEWSITAVGPTKLDYAHKLADTLAVMAPVRPIAIFSPGKSYPGETNPRWAIHLVSRKDGKPLLSGRGRSAFDGKAAARFRKKLLTTLRLSAPWIPAIDANKPKQRTDVLPLDHDGKSWVSAEWPFNRRTPIQLVPAAGPAGLRLPLGTLPEGISARALVLEQREDGFHLFLPPLLLKPFLALLRAVERSAAPAVAPRFEGYIPPDDQRVLTTISVTPDPGVLEINLPPAQEWRDHAAHLQSLENAAAKTGLRSYKQIGPEEAAGTGGGNHMLFGGPTLSQNPFFTNPKWLTTILRYWQRHPSLSYFFTGSYVGTASQAPRPDESSRDLYDLEMAYTFLENLPPGDHRQLISETLRHLHTDSSGNTHRSEISFDKFWNSSWSGGCRGLIEFRAVESLPSAAWMSSVALLWRALAALLLNRPSERRLVNHGKKLHDAFFLPSILWRDFSEVLQDLEKAGLGLDSTIFRDIWNWRFPTMLHFQREKAELLVRKALESWPLLCETPLEGGSTSRFVDTSMERLEFTASADFFRSHTIHVQGRPLPLQELNKKTFGCGLRYRRTRLHPSLHPGMPPHMPLRLTIISHGDRDDFVLEADRRIFEPSADRPAVRQRSCRKLEPDLLTFDLRL